MNLIYNKLKKIILIEYLRDIDYGLYFCCLDKTRPTIQVIVRQTSVVAVVGSTVQLVCYVEDSTGRVNLVWSRGVGLPPGM